MKEITEANWQKIVIKIAEEYGWKWYHPPDNIPNKAGRRQSVKAGYPDLTLVRNNRLIFIELKTNKGKATEQQEDWLEALSKAGAETHILRPKDILKVHKILK